MYRSGCNTPNDIILMLLCDLNCMSRLSRLSFWWKTSLFRTLVEINIILSNTVWSQLKQKYSNYFPGTLCAFLQQLQQNKWEQKLKRPFHSCFVSNLTCEWQFCIDTDLATFGAFFTWLSKVITWLRFLGLVIGVKDSRQSFNQWEARPKPIEPCTFHSSCDLSELQIIARNCDWFIVLFGPVMIGGSNCLGFGFSTVFWKPLYVLLLS